MSELTPETLHIINAGLKKGLSKSNNQDPDESVRAWMKARELMREHDLKVECLVGMLPESDPLTPESTNMPFGKYKGQQLGHIMRNDPGYIRWLAEDANLDAGPLRDAVETLWSREI